MRSKEFTYEYKGVIYPVIVTYKRMKTIRYRYKEGVFYISAPYFGTTKHDFSKGLDKFAEVLIKNETSKSKPIGDDYIYLFGQKVLLAYPGTIVFLGKLISFDNVQELLKKLRKPFLKYLTTQTEKYAKIMNAPLYQVKLREMRSRYGSNNRPKKTITYAMMLIYYSPEIIDSVVVHELVHCFVYDHSDNFYRLLYKYCPNYDKLRKKLINAEFN